ncbi:hypothetical protein GCM10023205_71630 [Yinghuangia aomiensis]|uniref:Uncharacterized protein n=1 Tax=Yinghuangia aomiensis TaxID=676205 RepID=A0ABP9I8D4_9ACTN
MSGRTDQASGRFSARCPEPPHPTPKIAAPATPPLASRNCRLFGPRMVDPTRALPGTGRHPPRPVRAARPPHRYQT